MPGVATGHAAPAFLDAALRYAASTLRIDKRTRP
jgi:hypothetical protein